MVNKDLLIMKNYQACVRMCQEDQRTVFGRTLKQIAQECKVEFPAKKNIVKKVLKYFPVPEEEAWRPPS